MKTIEKLPKGYKGIATIDMHNDKKATVWVNVISLLVVLAMIVPMLFAVPIGNTYDFSEPVWLNIVKIALTAVLTILYLSLHELVHGAFMKIFGAKNVKLRFGGLYFCAECSDYFGKIPYIVMMFSPVVVFAVLFSAVCALVSSRWFWIFYLIQVINLSGVAGDIVVACRLLKAPKDILVLDKGAEKIIYAQKK